MAIVYQVFSNDGAGGPVDYSSPIATVSDTSYTTGALAASGDYRFAVRALDTATGLAEANTQAAVRVVLDAAGDDAGQAPAPPFAVTARATADGGCLVAWSYFASRQAAAPTAFLVYLTAGTSPSLATPAATVGYRPGVAAYSCRLVGLADGGVYTISVASRGGGSSASAAASTTVLGDGTPPADVESLAAVAVP